MITYKDSFLALFAGILLLASCQDAKVVGPIDHAGSAPGTVSNVQVDNMHGAAKITYSLPKSPDLFYVEADYEIRPGVTEQQKSSYYNNSIVIQGFGDTSAHIVKLFAVNRAEVKSKPVEVTVKPLISPVQAAYATLTYDVDFGGIHAAFTNQYQSNLVVDVLIKDSTGDWKDYDKYYSSVTQGIFSVRGLPAVPTTFGVFIKDRWDNTSDTLVKDLTPIFEVELDKSKFEDMTAYLPGCPAPYSHSYTMPHMWDDDINSMYHTTQNVSDGAGFPLHTCFDLGAKAKLSRMKIWPRQGSWAYNHGNVKDMEIWGTNQDPSTWSPFSFNDWIKLGEYHCYKPSGSPVGTNTEADIELSVEGQEVEFPITDPPVRYIMFNVIDSWTDPPNAPGGFAHIAEVTFWGQPQP
jgi:hypothetical protein